MNLVLDGKVLRTSATTVGELIRTLSSLDETRDRVVRSILIDGTELEEWHESSQVSIAPTSEVVVTTLPLRQAILETVVTCIEYLPRLIEGGLGITTYIQQGLEREALHAIPDLIDGLRWYSEFLSQLASLRSAERELSEIRLSNLNRVLSALVSALEKSDFTLFADLLEYELIPELEKGAEDIRRLRSTLTTEMVEK